MQDTHLSTEIIESRGDVSLRDVLAPLFRHKQLDDHRFFAPSSRVGLRSVADFDGIRSTCGGVRLIASESNPMVTTESASQVLIPAPAVTEEEINLEAELLQSRDVLEK